MRATPIKAATKQSHCNRFIVCFKNKYAITTLKIGDIYCIVTAVPIGILCKVMKYNINAVVPVKPREISGLKFVPLNETFSLSNAAVQNNTEIKQRKKTISITGSRCNSLAKIFISENEKVASSMSHIPFEKCLLMGLLMICFLEKLFP